MKDIGNGSKTGMRPFMKNDLLKFLQVWSVIYGTKVSKPRHIYNAPRSHTYPGGRCQGRCVTEKGYNAAPQVGASEVRPIRLRMAALISLAISYAGP